MLRMGIAAIAGAAMIAATPAAAKSERVEADARCLALMAMLLNDAESAGRQGQIFVFGSVYYLGKVEGGDPGVDLEKLMREAARDLENRDRNAEANRCTTAISAAGIRMQTAGKALSESGAAEPGKAQGK